MRTRFVLHGAFLLSILALVTASGCESLRRRMKHEQPPLVLNIEEKIRLTREAAAAFENAAGGLYPDSDVQRYVREVAAKVVAAIPEHHPREYPFTFRVLDTGIVNAFALPGGYVYVTRGLLGKMRSEDELAAVLADQIAHVTMNHYEARFGEVLLVNLGFGVPFAAEMISGKFESPVYLPDSTAAAINLKRFRFTRRAEAEAAKTAAQYIARTGAYDPRAVIDALEMLDALPPVRDSALPAWHRTHPAPPERRQDITTLLERKYPEFLTGGKRFAEIGPALRKMRKAQKTHIRSFEEAEFQRDMGIRMLACGFPKNGRTRLETALARYGKAIAGARDSGVEVAAYYTGRALAYRGLFVATGDESFRKKARADFDDARRIDPQNFPARLFRGYYFLKVDGFYGRAEDELLEAVRLNPGEKYRGLPYLCLAELYDTPENEGRDREKAAHNYEMCLAMEPLGGHAPRVMKRLRELKPHSAVLALFR